MNRQPYAVQIAALNASVNPNGYRYPGFNFFMEQGLGKTGTAVMEFLDLVATKDATRMVVICPPSFKGGWRDEVEEWGFDVDLHIYNADNEWANEQWLKKAYTKPPLLVINFESVRPKYRKENNRKIIVPQKGMLYVERFMANRKVYFAIDESIQIASHDASQTDGVQLLSEKATYIRNLSGKPIRNGPHDLWAQLRVIRATTLNFYSFRNRFCRMGGFKGKQVVGEANPEKLAEILDPVTFRAYKKDWTDLPPKTYMPPLDYEMSREQMAQYKAMEDEFVLWLNDQEYVAVDAAITKYIKLAQIQMGFIFDADKRVRHLIEPSKNPRLAALEDLIKDQIPGKIIVVYNHKPVREYITDRYAKLRPVFIHGGMDSDAISAAKRSFNEDRDCRAICITKSAKYGHTLLGDQSNVEHACADMAFLENTYSLDDRSQLEDRPHRHGQLQDNMRYWDFAATPLDRNAVKALQRKESIVQAVFEPLRKTGRR